jgi:dihydroxyacetone kinase
MTHFVDHLENIVTDAIDGTIFASNGTLTRLDGYPHIRVVVRTKIDKTKVALVCGGGSGHEPAHAGFVGEGMLTAAVCGGIYASPSVEAVLAGILAATGEAGCLLILKNYTGDRLNFGLAAERARALGFKVEMVIVGDDIALPDLAQPRGLAGTLFIHKIAGALAQAGADLETVTAAAHRVNSGIKSLGMTLETCTVPGAVKEDRIPNAMAELGLGIHGEPGVEQIHCPDATSAINAVVAKLSAHMQEDQQYVMLINNLGGTSVLEMAVLMKALKACTIGSQLSHFVGPASMMTAIDMHGFSLSVYAADATELELLAAATPLNTWPGLAKVLPEQTVPVPHGLAPVSFVPSKNVPLRTLLISCCQVLLAAKDDLNTLDAKSGDGDTGTTVAGAANAIIDVMDRLPLADNAKFYQAISQELSQVMGGSSGVLLSIFFGAAGDVASGNLGTADIMKAGLARMMEVGGAKLDDRTMVDALSPALDALKEGVPAAAKAAREGATRTASLTKAGAGRSSYVSAAQLKGHVDPGAEAVALLFEHLAAYGL